MIINKDEVIKPTAKNLSMEGFVSCQWIKR